MLSCLTPCGRGRARTEKRGGRSSSAWRVSAARTAVETKAPLKHSVQDALLPEAEWFLEKLTGGEAGIVVGGESRGARGGGVFPVIDPSDGALLATIPAAEPIDVDEAVRSAREAFPAWRAVSPGDRQRMLLRVADCLEEEVDTLAQLEAIDVGKPLAQARHGDLPHAIATLRFAAGLAATSAAGEVLHPMRQPRDGSFCYAEKVPAGVVAAVTPWNFPLCQAVIKCAAALASGCTVVLKPPEQAPLTSIRFAEICSEELGPGVVNVVPGFGVPAGAHLASHPDVDVISFTGSTEVGRKIVAAAAESNLKRVTLELGGKSPTIIMADADLDAAAKSAAQSLLTNSGQVCCAGTRIFVERSACERVLRAIEAECDVVVAGAALNEESTFGPLVSSEQLEAVTALVDEGVKSGGLEVRFGGAPLDSDGFYFAPTVLEATGESADLDSNPAYSEEIFGPVGVVVPFEDGDIAGAAALANDTRYGLAAGVWTSSVSTAHRLAASLEAGSVWVNGYNAIDPALPFGGQKMSGWGREMGPDMLDEYLNVKTVTIQM